MCHIYRARSNVMNYDVGLKQMIEMLFVGKRSEVLFLKMKL